MITRGIELPESRGSGFSIEWFKKTLLSKKNSAPPVLYPEKFAEHDGTNIKAIHVDSSSLNVKM